VDSVRPEREARLHALAARLGHRFADLALLDQALTHASWAHEALEDSTRDNEPLEFLGDAVLGFIVTELLHRRDPGGNEGVKSKARARLVSSASLARRADALGLPDLLRLGRGEEKTGGRKKTALWADAYEAVIAALHVDGGMEAARRFVRSELEGDLEADAAADPKSALQELLQAQGEPVPEYVVVAEKGPSHRRLFRVHCLVQGRPLAEGEGHSKKEAQKEAARRALLELERRQP
jgi:ribonuclease-3